MSQQQEISIQNAILSNRLTTDALFKNVEEIDSMRLELQRIREVQETSRNAWGQLLHHVVSIYEMNEERIRMIATMQQETNSMFQALKMKHQVWRELQQRQPILIVLVWFATLVVLV